MLIRVDGVFGRWRQAFLSDSMGQSHSTNGLGEAESYAITSIEARFPVSICGLKVQAWQLDHYCATSVNITHK
jgi:hypothetical protein